MPINRERVLNSFLSLVAIDSPSLGERAMADEVTAQLQEMGLSVTEDDAGRKLGGNAGNLICRIPGDERMPVRLFSAHLDTVEPSHGKKPIVHADGTITSSGDTVLGADDLTAVCGILEAVRVILENSLPHPPLLLVFPAAEELHTLGSRALDFSGITADCAYVPDLGGSVGRCALRAPSILSFTALFRGRSAHAGMAPEEGIHAIHMAADAVSSVRSGHVDSETTVNIGRIEGGGTTNIVPDRCLVTGEVRSYRHASALSRMDAIQKTFQASAAKYGGSVDFNPIIHMQAYEVSPEAPVVARFLRACHSIGVTPELSETFGGSDNNAYAEHGIPGIVISNGMFKIHTCDEYTSADEIVRTAEMILALMTDPE